MINIGISAFGINDCLSTVTLSQEANFLPGVVILPQSLVSRQIITGKAALSSRIGVGLRRPKDARVDEIGPFMDRVLASTLWERMLRSKSLHEIQIKSASEVSFSCSQLLAEYIVGLLKDANCDLKSALNRYCVAIPTHLNAFQQEFLLRALRLKGFGEHNLSLLWRSIAVALSWLEKVNEENLQKSFDKKSLLTIYLGADSIEFDLIDLEQVTSQGKSYLVPCRNALKDNSLLEVNGLDVVANLALDVITNQYSSQDTLRSLWQVLNLCQDVWCEASGVLYKNENAPLVEIDNWQLWKPQITKLDLKSDYNFKRSVLTEILGIKNQREEIEHLGVSYLRSLNALVKRYQKQYTIASILLYGPMAGEAIASNMVRYIYNKPRYSLTPELNNVYLAGEKEVALGCQIYLEKKELGEITYYDFLPQLNVLYLDTTEQNYAWAPLVKEGRLQDGRRYDGEPIFGFGLQKGAKKLDFFLDMPEDAQKVKTPQAGDEYHCHTQEFSRKALKDLPLVIKATMQPASGLAKVELIEKTAYEGHYEDSVFNGKINVDYSNMHTQILADLDLGYPRVVDYNVLPDDASVIDELKAHDLWKGIKQISFIKRSKDQSYEINSFITDNFKYHYGNKFTGYYYLTNYSGQTLDKELLTQFANVLEKYLAKSVKESDYYLGVDNRFRNKLTWLFSYTPKSINDYYENLLLTDTSDCIKPAMFFTLSRVLPNFADKSIKKYISLVERLPINELRQSHIKALYNLFLRSSKLRVFMTKKLANLLITFSLAYFKETIATDFPILTKNVKLTGTKSRFNNGCLAFFTALTYREQDPTFLDKDHDRDALIFELGESLQNLKSRVDSLLKKSSFIGADGNEYSFNRKRSLLNAQKGQLYLLQKYLPQAQKDLLDFLRGQGNQSVISNMLAEDEDNA